MSRQLRSYTWLSSAVISVQWRRSMYAPGTRYRLPCVRRGTELWWGSCGDGHRFGVVRMPVTGEFVVVVRCTPIRSGGFADVEWSAVAALLLARADGPQIDVLDVGPAEVWLLLSWVVRTPAQRGDPAVMVAELAARLGQICGQLQQWWPLSAIPLREDEIAAFVSVAAGAPVRDRRS